MIKNIHIKNFKSVQDLELPLGRFNVLIGENGSGKSNVIEAIAFAGADAADKLDYEFLSSRGIRPASEARQMKSAFHLENLNEPISIEMVPNDKNRLLSYLINEDNKSFPKWIDIKKKGLEDLLLKSFVEAFSGNLDDIEGFKGYTKEIQKSFVEFAEKVKDLLKKKNEDELSALIRSTYHDSFLTFSKNLSFDPEVANFIIYSAENSYLRQIETESQIQPLGIRGEGLFNLLQNFSNETADESIYELKKFLHVIDWFDDFEILKDPISGKKYIQVKDRYLKEKLFLTQGNVNEGFLFLLFYISLFISNDTPAFFAIDNIEASFHPLLCTELTKRLIELAKSHNKQVIVTTHNPYILDGLDLNDADQRLFVIRRNADGETIADHIDKQPKDVKLSEAWTRGYIGANPQTIY